MAGGAAGFSISERFMRKLQIEDAEVLRIAIQQEIGRSEESRYDHRLHGLLLLAAGHSCRQVAELFGEDDTTVQRWVHRFARGGLTALREGVRPGRPPSLDQSQWDELEADLRRDPREFGLATHRWDGPALSKLLRLRYGVELGVRQCQRIFRQMGSQSRRTAHTVTDSAPAHASEMAIQARSGTAD
jgi:transposase